MKLAVAREQKRRRTYKEGIEAEANGVVVRLERRGGVRDYNWKDLHGEEKCFGDKLWLLLRAW